MHGGAAFSAPALIDDDAGRRPSTDLVPLAPLHNPANLEGIRVARRLFPDLPQVAVFDTAFHQTLPPHAYTYAVPRDLARGARDPALRLPRHLARVRLAARPPSCSDEPADGSTSIVLHLGNGCSACGVRGGRRWRRRWA